MALVLVASVVVSAGGFDTAGAGLTAGAPTAWPSAVDANRGIGRGVEIVSPCCGQDALPGDIEARAAAAASAGFTGVRYAVKLSPGQAPSPPYEMDPAYLDQVRAEIEVLTRHGLTVVVNNNESLDEPDRSGDRLVARWTQIAERFQDLPPTVYFEIANEPSWGGDSWGTLDDAVTPDQWNALVARVIPAIRATNPQRIIVVSSAYWSLPQAIPDLELPAGDGHLIATFHNYLPLPFTHQGSWLAGSDAWIGTTWTASPDEVAAMRATMNDAVCWSRETGVPLFNGEFSSFEAGRYTDRDPMRWNTTMVQLIEAEHISWTYFVLNGRWDPATRRMSGDALWDEEADRWNQPVLDALDQARAEPIEPWASCPGPTTSPDPTTGAAATPSSAVTPAVVAPRFTG